MSNPMFVSLTVLFSALVLYLLACLREKKNYPPGPKGYPFVGHTFQIPIIKPWKYFERLSHQYGPIVKLSLAGDDVIVLNRAADAEELLSRRSYNYSSRRPLIYAGKYQSNDKRLLLLPYGEHLKKQRAAFHQMLQPRVLGAYEAIQEIESVKLIHDMLVRPKDSSRHFKRFAASLVFHLTYGKKLADDDQDLNAVISIMHNFVKDTYPGAHLVDTFPVLDCLPDFLAPWREEALRKHDAEIMLYNRLALEVKDKMDNGDIGIECFAARLWDQQFKMDLGLEELSYVAGTAFEAGTDTTSVTLRWFLMAMVLYPHTMRKAQAELDAVLGSNGQSIPGFAHMNHLPYCVALTKEVFRWAPASPGGFPHYSDADDEYKGYKIHGKTIVIPCIWSMHHNEDEFQNSYSFDPDRFIRDGVFTEHDSLTEGHYGFGFGRRKCPGLHLASKSTWIGITRLLWGFNIGPDYDKNGVAFPVDPENCTSGIISEPVDFSVCITPRSDNHAETIQKKWLAGLE